MMKGYTKGLALLLTLYLVGQTFVLLYSTTSHLSNAPQHYTINKYLYSPFQGENVKAQRVISKTFSDSLFNTSIEEPNDTNVSHMHTFIEHMRINETRQVKRYRNFTITLPFFIDNTSRMLFFKNGNNLDAMQGRSPETLYGEIYMVRNATIDVTLECGFRSDTSSIHPHRVVQDKEHWFPVLAPFIVPDGHSFQHFLDGVLPKIVQALPLLQDRSVKILIRAPGNNIIYEILEKLNISSSQLVFQSGGMVYGADILIYPCIAPPIHPLLWQGARQLMGAPARLQLPLKQAYIVLVTRKGCHNCGRYILNKDEVVNMLTSRYGNERMKVFEGPISLAESVKLFGSTRIIMGTHGGGMYNINFAPSDTVVIEFMPTHDSGKMGAASDGIIWAMAQLLDQDYWRISLKPDRDNNVNVTLSLLIKLLDVVDKQLES